MDLSVRRDSRVGDAIMDLSSRGITVTRMIDCGAPSVAATAAPLDMSSRQHQNNNHNHNAHQQRSLRPRTSATSYAEGLDVVVIEDEPDPAASNFSAASLTRHRTVLDGCDSDVVPADVASWQQQQDDEEKPLPPPVKPLSGEERARRLDMVRRLRNELRTEETKLVLLQRMKHFQMNDAGLPSASPAASVRPLNNSSNSGTAGRATSALTVSAVRPDVKPQVKPPPAHHNRISGGAGASSVSVLSVSSGGDLSRLTAAQQNRFKSAVAAHQGSGGAASSTAFSYPLTSEVDIRRDSPVPQAPPAAHAKQHHSLSSHYQQQQQQQQPQAARQQQQHYQVSVEKRQAAAKLALRRQLEKTLLQIPPPKPPPPHMSFVPNGSNAQFVYLLGLEQTVDYLKSEGQHNQQAAAGTGTASTTCENFVCSQCGRDFTPVWRLDSDTATTIGNNNSSARTTATGGGGVRVTCEECVTSNVKKKLKAEHTSRLKAAFVKALQQEHEIETQLNKLAAAAAVVSGSPSPVPSPASGAPPPPPTPPTPETTITPIPNSGNMGRRDLNISQQHHSARHHNTHHAPHHHSHHHSHHHGSRSSPRPRDSPRHQQHVNSTDRSSRAGPSSSSSSAAAAAAKLSAAELEYMKKLADPKYAASALLNPVMMAAAMNQSAAAALASAQQQLLRLPTSTSAATSSSSSISSQQQQQQQQMLAAAAAGTFNPLLYSYQLAMAQVAQQQQQQQQAAVAAAAAKNPAVSGGGGHTAATAAATQQALADLQRQYLLDMIPSQQVLPPGWPRNAGSNNGTGGGAKR